MRCPPRSHLQHLHENPSTFFRVKVPMVSMKSIAVGLPVWAVKGRVKCVNPRATDGHCVHEESFTHFIPVMAPWIVVPVVSTKLLFGVMVTPDPTFQCQSLIVGITRKPPALDMNHHTGHRAIHQGQIAIHWRNCDSSDRPHEIHREPLQHPNQECRRLRSGRIGFGWITLTRHHLVLFQFRLASERSVNTVRFVCCFDPVPSKITRSRRSS